MSDVEAVKEAIERIKRDEAGGKRPFLADVVTVLDAARSFVRMVETGEQVEWCEAHRSSGERQRTLPAELRICDFAYAEDDGDDVCEFRPGDLILPLDEETK